MKRKDYAFRLQFIEKPSIIPGCPVLAMCADVQLPKCHTPTSLLSSGIAVSGRRGEAKMGWIHITHKVSRRVLCMVSLRSMVFSN